MEALNIKSQLEQHLESADAYSLSALTPADYSHGVYLYCSERNALNGQLRHADTIDLDHNAMLPAISACADLVQARAMNDTARINALLHIMGECVDQALKAAADEAISDVLYRIAVRNRVDPRDALQAHVKGWELRP